MFFSYICFYLQSAADHTGYLIQVREEQLCYLGNVFDVFNFGFLKRISVFLDDLVSKYNSGGLVLSLNCVPEQLCINQTDINKNIIFL